VASKVRGFYSTGARPCDPRGARARPRPTGTNIARSHAENPFRSATLRDALIGRRARKLVRQYAKLFGEKLRPAYAWAGTWPTRPTACLASAAGPGAPSGSSTPCASAGGARNDTHPAAGRASSARRRIRIRAPRKRQIATGRVTAPPAAAQRNAFCGNRPAELRVRVLRIFSPRAGSFFSRALVEGLRALPLPSCLLTATRAMAARGTKRAEKMRTPRVKGANRNACIHHREDELSPDVGGL
jgi:hypothetical protein